MLACLRDDTTACGGVDGGAGVGSSIELDAGLGDNTTDGGGVGVGVGVGIGLDAGLGSGTTAGLRDARLVGIFLGCTVQLSPEPLGVSWIGCGSSEGVDLEGE
eukprot:12423303-Karenia_brevis.AAC.1